MSGARLPGSAIRGLAGARRLRVAASTRAGGFPAGQWRITGAGLAQGCPAGASPRRATVPSRSPGKPRRRFVKAAPEAPEGKGRAQAAPAQAPGLANEPPLCPIVPQRTRVFEAGAAGGVRRGP